MQHEDSGDDVDGAKVTFHIGPSWAQVDTSTAQQPDAVHSGPVRLVPEDSIDPPQDLIISSSRKPCQTAAVPKSLTVPCKKPGSKRTKHVVALRKLGAQEPVRKNYSKYRADFFNQAPGAMHSRPQATTPTALRSQLASTPAPVAAPHARSIAPPLAAGLQQGVSPAPRKAACRTDMRSLATPQSSVTMSNLLPKRPQPQPGPSAFPSIPESRTPTIPAQPPSLLPGSAHRESTPQLKPPLSAQTTAVLPTPDESVTPALQRASVQPRLKTPVTVAALAAAAKYSGKVSTAGSSLTSEMKRRSKTPAATAASSKSFTVPMPGSATGGHALPPPPKAARTRAELFAGVEVQDKPSALFAPAGKPKKHKSKACGMLDKLEQELTKLKEKAEAPLSVADLEDMPHIMCRTVCEPVFEGHLVKLLCDIEDFKAPVPKSQRAAVSAGTSSLRADQPSDSDGTELLENAARVFVFFDKAAEKRIGLHVGSDFVVLHPWDVVVTPQSQFPVVLALVAAEKPQM